MANTEVKTGADIIYDQSMQMAQNVLVRELAVLGSKLEDRKPISVESELRAAGLPYRLYYSLNAYPPLDNPYYQTVEQYLSRLYGQRNDIRILQMAFSGVDSWITTGLAISYPDLTEDVAIEERIVNPKTEHDLGSFVKFDHRQGLASAEFFGPFGTRTNGEGKTRYRAIHFLTPEILSALSGIVSSEQDLGRWNVEFVPVKPPLL